MQQQGGSLILENGEACVYPTPTIAKQHLPNLSAPSSRHFAGFFDAIAKIVQYEGTSTLWRGLSASLVMSVPSQVMYMVGYDYLRTTALDNVPPQFLSTGALEPSSVYVGVTTFVSGSISRTAVAALLAPLELFRTRLQSTGSHITAMNVTHSVRDLVRAQGVSSLWRGLSATLWRDVPFSGVYWAGYEAIRRALSGGRGMGEINHSDKASKTFGIAFASGAGSGMVSF
jgi:solute carrier family 25 protein 39/40